MDASAASTAWYGMSAATGSQCAGACCNSREPDSTQGVMLHRSPLPPKKIRTHILVLETFVGPRPEGMHGCHYDDNPMNNRLDNLRWDTPRANRMDEIRNGNNHQANKTHCAQGQQNTPGRIWFSPRAGTAAHSASAAHAERTTKALQAAQNRYDAGIPETCRYGGRFKSVHQPATTKVQVAHNV